MARYLDSRADLTFKRVFADHPDLLIDFLNAVMPFEQGCHIASVEYLPSELLPDHEDRKYSIVDIRCRDNRHNQFIIEMQMFWYEAFMKRLVFNAGKAFVKQLDAGKKYHALKPVYTLAILNEDFDGETDEFYHHFQIINRLNTDEVIPGLEFVLIELAKFRPENASDRKLMVLWLRFLKEVNESMDELPPEMQENENIKKAAELCRQAAFTPEELAGYEKFWDVVSSNISMIEDAKIAGQAIGREIGQAIGQAIGHAIGHAEGHAKGHAEGRAERDAEVAKLEEERSKLEQERAERDAEVVKLEQERAEERAKFEKDLKAALAQIEELKNRQQ